MHYHKDLPGFTDTILMVRPASFGYNPETAGSNAFQSSGGGLTQEEISQRARAEFDDMVALLRDTGIRVLVAEDSPKPRKSDAVFPNNWVTFHRDGTVVTYPMYAPSRRLERRPEILDQIEKTHLINKHLRLEDREKKGQFLEGTGSMVLDRDNKVAYGCISARLTPSLFEQFGRKMGYRTMAFHAAGHDGKAIYHTNVMMAMGTDYAVICLEAITNEETRQRVTSSLSSGDREIIEIDHAQMGLFAGNMLQLKTSEGQPVLVMSQSAFLALRPKQVEALEKRTQLSSIPLPTIEHYGGGSARCMMAEVFLPEREG